ncbi:MAG: methyltransferase domain-containing protein [Anaerolineaceae bacterium]
MEMAHNSLENVMVTKDEQKQQQKKTWGGAATDWEALDDWFEHQSRDLTEWLCASCDIGPGMRVLDLASGTGQPGFTAAGRVGPTGKVISTDFAPEMVAAAQRLSVAKGLTNVEHREVDIENIPFEEASFDVVTCRFGLMFCPDPIKAASEMARVLKPGGRFALAVWDVPAKNPQFTSFLSALAKVAPPPPADPKAPGLFRLAAPGEFESVLRAGGFEDVTVESVPGMWEFTSPENYWEIMFRLAAPLKAAAANLPPETLTALRESITESLRAAHGDGAVRLTATALGARGRK